MIRLIWRFAILVGLAALFTWLADSPGTVTVVWRNKEISTSAVAAAAFVAMATLACLFLWNFVMRLWRSPRAVGDYWRFRKNRKGYESLSRGIIAAGAGDSAAAAKHAAAAGNALADEPLVNVLAAQAAQLKGDRHSVKRIFEAMTKSPETEALGLRGLFVEARQAGDIATARRHAERALNLNPRLAWASSATLHLQLMSKDWVSAAQTLAQQVKSGTLPKDESNRKQAALFAAQALALEDKQPTEALNLATKALKLDPSLVPAALVASRIQIANGSQRKAQRILRETWVLSPHPDLAEVMARLKAGDGPEARFERVRDLVGENPGGLEGAYALARAAAEAQRWAVARKVLEPWLESRPQARICVVMADIEEAAGDKGRAREWLARAVTAPRDPIWVSDGVASPRWTPISPVSAEIVPCEWKAPFEMPGEPQKLAAQVAQAPATEKLTAPPPKPVEPPRMVESFHAPDDPGIHEATSGPEAAVRRQFSSES